MNNFSLVEITGPGRRAARYNRWRRRKDGIARKVIALGGMGVILAVLLIFLYLLLEILPLFLSASAERQVIASKPAWVGQGTVLISVEEQLQVGLRVDSDARAEFFSMAEAKPIDVIDLVPPGSGSVLAAATAGKEGGLVSLVLTDGKAVTFTHTYTSSFEGGVEKRQIVPAVRFPYGKAPKDMGFGRNIQGLAVSDTSAAWVLAAFSAATLQIAWHEKLTDFLSGEARLEQSRYALGVDYAVTAISISGDHRWLYAGDDQGNIHRYQLPRLQYMETVQISSHAISSMEMLLGGVSLLAGDVQGNVAQLFPVRDANNEPYLRLIRVFPGKDSAIAQILPEHRRKGFAVFDRAGELRVYYGSSERMVLQRTVSSGVPLAAGLAPRANGLLLLESNAELSLSSLNNPHPEVSLKSLWRKVWYENYDTPRFVWQSSAANNEFEPKFSLTPLAFGTLKAAAYALLFAIPLAVLGAAYTACFMAPGVRKLVKPVIETMAVLPTVILGFLAGLWFAPFIETHLTGVLLIALLLPPALFLCAYLWTYRPNSWAQNSMEGWEAILILPVLAALIALILWIAQPLEQWWFDGSLSAWLTREKGISYDQRNALVVGVAMGFAIIPTIFTISEDALFSVPKQLSEGSQALGATRWQTLLWVIVPTASPGIFSALMIGFGRAVGETMIVLMATGNTPIMDWSLFEGMRTLAANIAVEMPEAEVASTHYRILFLAAFALFVFTFMINTLAELVRQRLRNRYGSL